MENSSILEQLKDLTPVTKNGFTYVVAIPLYSTTRRDLAAIPGVTVLDSHLSPHPIKAEHYAILKAHGASPTDTYWTAIEKMNADLGLEDLFDPNI